jgi:preprotein translocase subunit SecG
MFNGLTLLTTSGSMGSSQAGSILAAGFFMNFLLVIWILSAVALVFIILIQKGKGGGLSSAFGGGMASNILGANTKKPLTWFTIGLVGIFLFLAILLAKFYPSRSSDMGPATPSPMRQPTEPAEGGPTSPTNQAAAPVVPQTTSDANFGR